MKEIKIEGKVDTWVVVDYLDHLSKGVKSGKVLIKKRNNELTLEPEGKIEIKVEAKQKRDKEKLEFRISWDKSRKPSENLKIN